MELIPLFSGSSGNCTLVRTGSTNILIDAGRNCKAIVTALTEVGTKPEDIDAVFITHSHSDHVSGLDVFVRKYPTKLYATEQTFRSIKKLFRKPHLLTPDLVITPGEKVEAGDGISVICTPTPHDADGSVCYKILSGKKEIMIMTDVGYMTEQLKDFAKGVDGILIESNYDRRMLAYGDYPESLKIRIAGDGGHLSNDDCAETMKFLIDNGTRNFILGHLSENNNTPEKAETTVTEYLSSFGLTKGEDYFLRTAHRYCPTEAMVIE